MTGVSFSVLGLPWIATFVKSLLILTHVVVEIEAEYIILDIEKIKILDTRNLSGLFYEDCSALYVKTVRDYLDLVILLPCEIKTAKLLSISREYCIGIQLYSIDCYNKVYE